MCGIAGYIYLDKEKQASREIAKRMTDVIAHRGPDGEGFFIDKNLALGHRRLSIIDLSTGDQPMFSEDKSIALVFNGEIYNYIELRDELKSLGHTFRTTSDTEVIIHAYQQWGTNCQTKFNGCWGFALWDDKEKYLFVSRDRLGEKPIHYSIFNNAFVFGSEIKSLFAFGVPDEKDLSLVELYLFLKFIPAPFTFFKNIKKLMPGHYLIIKDNHVKEHKYWDLPDIDERNMAKNKKAIYEEFESLLKNSIDIRMRSDVPFGALLSGGLDSASIVALMSDISKYPVETFTIGYEQSAFDEKDLAQDVADKFNTNHHVYNVIPESFEESLNKVLYHYDEPFGDSSAIPTGIVSQFARKYVKMVLTGDGGDEVLSGYPSFQGVKLSSYYKKAPGFVREAVPNALGFFSKSTKGTMRYRINRYERLFRTANLDFASSMIERMPTNEISSVKNLFKNRNDIYSIEDYTNDLLSHCSYNGDFYKLMFLNFKLFLPEDYLVKVDRMSMAHSLEARVPFIDHRLVEFSVGIDKNIKMERLERKSILRNTVGKKMLPPSLLKASKKGFRVPLVEWFKQPEMKDRLEKLYKNDFGLNESAIKNFITDNSHGIKDNSNIIWMLIVLQEICNRKND
jgi:asparagine synthase (glutamine-hydrolysing)